MKSDELLLYNDYKFVGRKHDYVLATNSLICPLAYQYDKLLVITDTIVGNLTTLVSEIATVQFQWRFSYKIYMWKSDE